MKLKKKTLFGLIVGVVAIILLWNISFSGPGQYDDFAECLTEAGAKMYGAYWCSHCNTQKEMFGKSWKFVNYIECAEGNGQTQECKDAGITGYPTWEFGDESRQSGKLPLDILSERTGCSL